MTRTYHHGNLRDALLARAEEQLATDGVDGISLRGLARDLGVSHAAPARHFRDKQALLDALALAGFRRLDDALRRALAAGLPDSGPGDTFDAHVRALGRSYALFAIGNPQLLDVMYAGKHHPEASAELLAAAHHGMELVAEGVRAGQAAGVVRAGDPDRLARLLFAAVHGLAQLATSDLLEGEPVDDLLEDCLEMCVRGLRAPGGGAHAVGPGGPHG